MWRVIWFTGVGESLRSVSELLLRSSNTHVFQHNGALVGRMNDFPSNEWNSIMELENIRKSSLKFAFGLLHGGNGSSLVFAYRAVFKDFDQRTHSFRVPGQLHNFLKVNVQRWEKMGETWDFVCSKSSSFSWCSLECQMH